MIDLKLSEEEYSLKYIIYVLIICAFVLLFYSYINCFILYRLIVGIPCIITALLISSDIIYIRVKGVSFHSNLVSITSFTALCIFIGIIREPGIHIGRMWILLLPGVFFYTQSIKRSLILMFSVIVINLLPILISSIGEDVVDIMLNLEQLISFSLILFMTYLYAKAADKKNKELEFQHYNNSLTGLPNKNRLNKNLELNGNNSISYINIDDFKKLNTLYGSIVGDEVLKIMANRLKKFISNKKSYKLYQLNGNEFVIMNSDFSDSQREINYISKLISTITDVIIIDNLEIYPSISVGLSFCSFDLLKNASIALKIAKDSRKNLVVYDEKIDIKKYYSENYASIHKLKTGIKSGGIVPYFQPIINLSTGISDKFECLSRLKYEGETILPGNFIDISKQVKVYNIITKTMIDKSFAYFSGSSSSFSINLDSDDLMNSDTTSYIINKILEYGNGKQIILEILETLKIEDHLKVIEFIDIVKTLGCKIAIDDFGSGYSNFDYLIKFQIDFIKIDASLIKNIDIDRSSYLMTKSIVSFAKELGIKTVAEHIDKESICKIVKELGIDYGQGFFWSAPEPAVNFLPVQYSY